MGSQMPCGNWLRRYPGTNAMSLRRLTIRVKALVGGDDEIPATALNRPRRAEVCAL